MSPAVECRGIHPGVRHQGRLQFFRFTSPTQNRAGGARQDFDEFASPGTGLRQRAPQLEEPPPIFEPATYTGSCRCSNTSTFLQARAR